MNDDRHLHDDQVRAFLSAWRDAPTDEHARTRLIMALKTIPLPAPHVQGTRLDARARVLQAWLILRAQRRVVGATLCVAMLLMMTLGAMVTLSLSQVDPNRSGLAFVLVAPIIAAFGVAFLYGDDADPALELQAASPVSPRLIVLARLALVFTFDLVLALIASIFLAASSANITLLPLIAAWLAPMTCLSALAFLMSVLLFDPLISALLALALWAAVVARHIAELPFLQRLPDMLTPEARPVLYLIALIGVAFGVMLSVREDHLWKRR